MSLKSRNWSIILYPLTKSYNYNCVLDNLIDFTIKHKGNYFYITHDSDLLSNGEEDEIHTHFIINIPSKDELGNNLSDTTLDSVSKCGVPNNYINKIDSSKYNILYLAHQSPNSTSKYNYDWHDVKTNNQKKLEVIFANDEEQRNVYALIDYIDSSAHITYSDFCKFVLSHNLWSYYRRAGAIINNVIKEHNEEFSKYKFKEELDKTI